ncbi:LCP family protein [Streptomyces sp. NPDC055078]
MDADVTDRAGTPTGPDPEGSGADSGSATPGTGPADGTGTGTGPGAGAGPAAGAEAEAGPAAEAGTKRGRHWVRWTALGASVVLLTASAVAWWFYRKLDGNITTDTTAAAELEAYEKERPTPIALGARNVLILGSDTRSGRGNSKYGRDSGSQRADTTILLHLAADRRSATAMSLPRDLMAEIPGCRKTDGSRSHARFAQFNSAFATGGAACTIRTVERMTGVRVDHHIVVDFSGFKKMVDSIDGVEVCLPRPINDRAAHLKLPAGRQTLDGEAALGYVRARKTLGNGSDTERMDRQQQFLGALVKKVQSNGVLLNPAKLYPLLDAATKSLTTDPGLDSLRDLYDLTRSVRGIPTEKVQFLTVPRRPYATDANRDELVQPAARQLFGKLREDSPIAVLPPGSRTDRNEPGTDSGDRGRRKRDGDASTDPTANPTFPGTNAAVGTCR